MPTQIRWTRSLNAKLGGLMAVLSAVTLGLIVANAVMLSEFQGNAAKMNLLGIGRAHNHQILFNLGQAFADDPEAREQARSFIGEAIREMDYRFDALLNGDPSRGVPRAADPEIRSRIRNSEQAWRSEIKPALERILSASSAGEVESLVASVESILLKERAVIGENVNEIQTVLSGNVARSQTLQYVFFAVVIAVLGATFWIALGITRRTRLLALTAESITAGEFDRRAPVRGSDEIAMLGESFNTMTGTLRKTIETEKEGRARLEQLLAAIDETAASLASAASEILAATTQQASGAEEQAAAVTETVSTVDEIAQTAEQSAERAKAVAESSERAAEIGDTGRKAVDHSVESMEKVRTQSESIAESILALAEQAQAIGEIIATVNDIAEQTNLLALNAGIEASRAGEHGSGFTVVAREIKDLADQAKKATAQVRRILGEIQQATNTSVMTTEEGTKSVNATIETVNEAGQTIRTLAETINEAARTASQIAASAGQQATGMAQIQQAMKEINQTTTQNLASTKQAEKAAQDLNELGTKLKGLMQEREAA